MNKHSYYFILIFTFFLISTTITLADSTLPLAGKTIIIDPGHGGLDPGTVYENVYEKDINLKISLYLKDELEQEGGMVILTRDGDYDLSKPNASFRKKSDFDNRIKLINNNGDIYISIHLNYLDNSFYFGPQVFYGDINLAKNISKFLDTTREVKKIPSETYMYDKLNIPGVLVECGFLSNSLERNKLITQEYQQEIAIKIKQGIIAYFN